MRTNSVLQVRWLLRHLLRSPSRPQLRRCLGLPGCWKTRDKLGLRPLARFLRCRHCPHPRLSLPFCLDFLEPAPTLSVLHLLRLLRSY